MRPRTAYRISVIALPITLFILVASLVEGSWLLAILAVLALANGLVTVVQSRRLGLTWNSPNTFRHLRELRASRKAD